MVISLKIITNFDTAFECAYAFIFECASVLAEMMKVMDAEL